MTFLELYIMLRNNIQTLEVLAIKQKALELLANK